MRNGFDPLLCLCLNIPIFKYGKMMKTLLTVAFVLAPAIALTLAGQGQGEALSCTGRGHRIMSEYVSLYDAAAKAQPGIQETRRQMSIALLRGERYEYYDRPVALQARITALSRRLTAQEDAMLAKAYPVAVKIVALCSSEGHATCKGFGGLTKTQHEACATAEKLVEALSPRRVDLMNWPPAFGAPAKRPLETPMIDPVDKLLRLKPQTEPASPAGYISAGFLLGHEG